MKAEVRKFLSGYYCETELASILQSMRKPPPTTLRANTLLCTQAEAQTGLAAELSSPCIAMEQPKDALLITGSGPHPCDLTDVDKVVLAGRKAAEMVMRGAQLFAPGVIATSAGVCEGDTVAVYGCVGQQPTTGTILGKPHQVHPGTGVLGRPTALADMEGAELIGTGTALLGRKMMFNLATREGVAVELHPTTRVWRAPALHGVLPGQVYAQNLPSILASHLLDPQPGEEVLDMCAAPGGKTSHIAALMGNRGRVTALDISEPKIKRIRDTCEKLGVTVVTARKLDAAKAPKVLGTALYDRVLLDAPCSAMGTRPKLEETANLKELKSHATVGRKLFAAAAELLKPGGVLVYSTCTYNPLENEEQVATALRNLPLCLEAPPAAWEHMGEPGLQSTSLTEQDAAMVRRFPPGGKDNTIGFFMARFRRL